MNYGDDLKIIQKDLGDRIRLNLKGSFQQRLYDFRHSMGWYSCEECGSTVKPEWFAQHAKYHFYEKVRNFSGF